LNKEQFVAELAKLRPSSTFLTLMGYRNAHSEVANYSIVFHISYANALQKSIRILQELNTSSPLEQKACQELLHSYSASLEWARMSEFPKDDDVYSGFLDENLNHIKGIKMHCETQTLHLYGLVVHKRVLMPGCYSESRNRRELTIAKDNLRKLCPVSKFRQFKIVPEQVDYITVENLSLLPPME
jgi:hypothetical protein